MPLLNLPNEVLLIIARYLSPSIRDLNFLWQANRRLNFLLSPLLFEYITENSNSLLLWASQKGQLALVKVVLENGADISHTDKRGWTLLHLAAANGHDSVVRYLLEKGIRTDIVSPNGKTALERAASFGHAGVIRTLIEWGLYVNAMDSDGQTPLHWAAAHGENVAIEILLENGADVDVQGPVQGNTPLHWATMCGHKATALLLLDAGANIATRDFGGRTILHYAARSGDGDLVRAILDRGAAADINVCNNSGETAFHTAAFEMGSTWAENWKGVLKLLMDRGINAKVMDNGGRTGLDIALDGGCPWSSELDYYYSQLSVHGVLGTGAT